MKKKTKRNVFDDLRDSLQDALAHERGKSINLRATGGVRLCFFTMEA
jgi:hypothetical protein